MTDSPTPPAVRPRWICAVLALTCTSACAVHLHPADTSARRPTPSVTSAPAATGTTTPDISAVPIPTPTATDSTTPETSSAPIPTSAAGDTATPGGTPAPMPTSTTVVTSPSGRFGAADEKTAAAAVDAAVGTAPLATAPALATGTVTLQRRGDLFVAPAQINGRVLGDVLLDTGAGATFIDQRLANERQFPELIIASTARARADDEASIHELHGLTIGGVALATDRTFIVDLGSGDTLIGGRLAGVIGFPALGSAPFTLDLATGTLLVHPDASFEPPAGVPAEALRIDQGLPFVEATLADGTTVWLLLDTGSSAGLTVWHGFAKQHPGSIKRSSQGTATGNAAPESELRSLRLLGTQYDRIPVAIAKASARPWQRARVVGRVGMAVLRDLRITVHPATERIWVERP